MIIRSACYIDAVDHLPPTALLVFPQVAWEEYEELLQDLGDQPGLCVSYDEGRLEIMSPSAEHEEYKEIILRPALFCHAICHANGRATLPATRKMTVSDPA